MKWKQILAVLIAAALLTVTAPAGMRAVVAAALPVPAGYTRYECENGELHGCNKESLSSRPWGGDVSGGSWVFGLGGGGGSMGNLAYDFGNVSHVRLTVPRTERGVVTLKVGYLAQGAADPINAGNVMASSKFFAVKVGEEGTAKKAEIKDTWASSNPWSTTNTNGFVIGVAEVEVVMDAGDNTVYISRSLEGGWINLDYVDVSDATDTNAAHIEAVEPTPQPIPPGGNPFITAIYTADPSARVWQDGRLYVYASHDMEPPNHSDTGCDKMDRYHVYSTDNMVDWRDEGEIWSSAQVEWDQTPEDADLDHSNSGLDASFMWAPDCMYKNGKYYFFYPRPTSLAREADKDKYDGQCWNNTWVVGVLVSDFPDKDFTSLGVLTKPDGTPWTGTSLIDPNIFEDDDGKMYIFHGGGGRGYYAELNDDMVSLKTEPVMIHGNGSGPLTYYHEGPWVFKREGLYYFTYPGRGANSTAAQDRLLYATAPSVHGPWTYRGAFLDITGCDTSHGSVVEYKGHWYLFYHNQSISGRGNHRSVMVDELFFNEDGTIRMVQQTDTGPEAVGEREQPDPSRTVYEAEDAALGGTAAVLTTDKVASGEAVRVQAAGDSVTFSGISGGTVGGRASLRFRYASDGRAKWRLTVNGKDWSTVNLMSSGGIGFYCGQVDFTVPVTPGNTNTVTIERVTGRVMLDDLVVTPFNDADEEPLPYTEPTRMWMNSSNGAPEAYQTVTVTASVSGALADKRVTFSVSDEEGLELVSTVYDAEKAETTAVIRTLLAGAYTVYAETADGAVRNSAVIMVEEANDPPFGDVNLDGSVDSTDARMVLQYEVALIPLKKAQQYVGNVSALTAFDEGVDSTDARMILQYEVGLITSWWDGR